MENKKLSIEKELEFFFQDPKIQIEVNEASILHLLRRDVYRCMGYTKVNEEQKLIKDENVAPILWPGIMAVLAGIDLLGKFYAGDDNNNGVHRRFTAYCRKYIDSENSEVIFQFRNSLLHSFGLFSKTKDVTYHFQLTALHKELVTVIPVNSTFNYYRIDLYTLWDEFENSIEKYREDLMKNDKLQQKFHKMFELYGMTHPANTFFSSQKNRN